MKHKIIERFDIAGLWPAVRPSDTGEFVEFTEYQELLSKYAALQRKVKLLSHQVKHGKIG